MSHVTTPQAHDELLAELLPGGGREFDPAEFLSWPVLRFAEAIVFVENPRVAGGSERTRYAYRGEIRNLQKYFDERCRQEGRPVRDLVLGDIDDRLLAGAMAWQATRGLSRESSNKLRTTIRALHAFARRERKLPAPPLTVKPFKVAKRRPQGWLIGEFDALLAATDSMPGRIGPNEAGHWWRALLLFLFNTGSRISATMHCPTAGLDLDRGYVLLPAEIQKHAADESFELLPETVAALRRLKIVQRGLPCIFDDWPHDRCRDTNWRTLNNHLKRLIVAAGLAQPGEKLSHKLFHRIRRTFGSYICKAAGSNVAQQMLGHSSPSVTKLYLDDRITGNRSVAGLLPTPHLPDAPPPLAEQIMARLARQKSHLPFADSPALVRRDNQANYEPPLELTTDEALALLDAGLVVTAGHTEALRPLKIAEVSRG